MAKMEITLSKWKDMALIKELDQCITNSKPFYSLDMVWFICERIDDITNRMVVYSLEVYRDNNNF